MFKSVKKYFYLSIVVFLFFNVGCVGKSNWSPISKTKKTRTKNKKFSPKFFQKIETEIKLRNLENINIKAVVFRPLKMVVPKVIIIFVPGSGNVSRKGEILGNGAKNYKQPIELNNMWGHKLANNGFFVLSYDKRTYEYKNQKDINKLGIRALSNDLDQVVDFVETRLSGSLDKKIFLASTTQGAQVISESKSLKHVDGVILFSPIISDLQKTWVNGLEKASERESNQAKNTLLVNQAESTKAFFASLNKGDFPSDSVIRGASVKFWHSWQEASKKTLSSFVKSKKPVLILFSYRDMFAPEKNIKTGKNIKIIWDVKGDRNFIVQDQIVKEAQDRVVDFISKNIRE